MVFSNKEIEMKNAALDGPILARLDVADMTLIVGKESNGLYACWSINTFDACSHHGHYMIEDFETAVRAMIERAGFVLIGVEA